MNIRGNSVVGLDIELWDVWGNLLMPSSTESYLHGGYDEDGDVIPIENLGPHDDMEDAIWAIEADPTAVSILVAQGRTSIGGHEIGAVVRGFEPDYGHIEDPESNPLWGPDTD